MTVLGIQAPIWPEEPGEGGTSDNWIQQGLAYAQGIWLWQAQLLNVPKSSKRVVKQLMLHLQQSDQLNSWDLAVMTLISPDVQQQWDWKRWETLGALLDSLELTASQHLGISIALAQKQQISLAATGWKTLISQCTSSADIMELLALFITEADTEWHTREAVEHAHPWLIAVEVHLQFTHILHQSLQDMHADIEQAKEILLIGLRAISSATEPTDQWVRLPKAKAVQLALAGQATKAIECLASELPGWLAAQERMAHAQTLVCQLLAQNARWQEVQQLHQTAVVNLTSNPEKIANFKAQLEILHVETELLSHELSLALGNGSLNWKSQHKTDQLSGDRQDHWRAFSRSQLGQDLWVLEQLGWKRGGFFVEFGATDGVLLSNSWLLEKHFEWQGLCAEPNPKLFAKLQQNRSCQLSPACIYRHSGERMRFILADAYGGLEELGREDQHVGKREAYAEAGGMIEITTTSLTDFLEHHNAPPIIDYLSIDTEGSELAILEGMNWDRFQFRYITVEHNFTSQREGIQYLLESQGYQRKEAQWDDWYWKEID